MKKLCALLMAVCLMIPAGICAADGAATPGDLLPAVCAPADGQTLPEETAPAADDPAPAEDEADAPDAALESLPEETAPETEEPAPAEDEAAAPDTALESLPEETAPAAEEPAPAEDEAAAPDTALESLPEETAPETDDPAPAEDEPATETDVAIPAEADELTGTAAAGAPAAQAGPLGTLTDLALTPSQAGTDYSGLAFSFAGGESLYSGLITGIRTQDSGERFAALAQDIADSFLAGQTFKFSETDLQSGYGITAELIDAEKENASRGDDSLMCWAASAADMMEVTGWNCQEDEDAAYAAMAESFTNAGSNQRYTLIWYMNGVNPLQQVDADGSVLYPSDGQGKTSGGTQQLEPGTGGYCPDYAATAVVQPTSEMTETADRLEDGINALEAGGAVGIGIYFYSKTGAYTGGHALTVFGYISEWEEETRGSLKALIVADSDNNASSRETAPREERPNTYTMYTTGQARVAGGGTAVTLPDYSGGGTRTVIGSADILPAKNAVTALEETGGTKDAAATFNLTPTALYLENGDTAEVKAGDTLTLGMDMTNMSYAAAPADGVVTLRFLVYRDGALVDTVEKAVTLESGQPLSGASATADYTVPYGGAYTITAEIAGVTDASGAPAREAYTSDNAYNGAPIALQAAGDPAPAPETGPDAEPETAPETAPAKAETVYTLYVAPEDTEFLLDIYWHVPDGTVWTLRDRKTRETVDPEHYAVERADVGCTVSFTEDFIRSLLPGRHNYTLSWKGGRVLICIVIL